jgi:hypothetical protein
MSAECNSVRIACLHQLASAFRKAIEEAKHDFPDYLKRKFASFPEQTCGHASTLLALYLMERGFNEVQQVFNGCRGKNCDESHAWLEVGGLIVDITADQFSDRIEPVVVTRDHTWHSEFYGEIREPAIRHFDSHSTEAKENYEKAYAQIKKWLPEDLSEFKM